MREDIEVAREIIKLGRIVVNESVHEPGHGDVESFEEVRGRFLELSNKFLSLTAPQMANPNRVGGGRGH